MDELGGQSRPSFQTLVALAESFGASLDYLVFGDRVSEAVTPDFGPLARYMDVSLRHTEQRAQQHSAMVGPHRSDPVGEDRSGGKRGGGYGRGKGPVVVVRG
jgi:hypothetical protein